MGIVLSTADAPGIINQATVEHIEVQPWHPPPLARFRLEWTAAGPSIACHSRYASSAHAPRLWRRNKQADAGPREAKGCDAVPDDFDAFTIQ